MNSLTRRIATGAVLTASAGLIALGAAGIGHADTVAPNPGPAISHPAPHHPFPTQDFSIVTPGTWAHHHNQMRHG